MTRLIMYFCVLHFPFQQIGWLVFKLIWWIFLGKRNIFSEKNRIFSEKMENFSGKMEYFPKRRNIFPGDEIFFYRERLSRKKPCEERSKCTFSTKNVNQIFQSDFNVRKIEVSENWCVLCMQSNQMDIQMCLLHWMPLILATGKNQYKSMYSMDVISCEIKIRMHFYEWNTRGIDVALDWNRIEKLLEKKTANTEQETVEIDSIVIAFSWGDSFEWYYCIVA